ncbi:MAG: dihydrodipicolinate reductase [Gemmobacter sp.]
MRQIAAIVIATLLPLSAAADTARIESRDQFVALVRDRALHLTGIAGVVGVTLRVKPDGAIEGKASGSEVKGAWTWDDGLFCRNLVWGERDLGPNCQVVEKRGERLRFIADRGQGQHADFRLR